jgi:molybdopterin synthase catalytic subunit
MRVRVLFFGVIKELIGKSHDDVDVRDGGSVRELLEHYESTVPELKKWYSSLALAVNQQYARPDTILKPNDEVALLPPVSGGAPHAAEAASTMNQLYVRVVRDRIDTEALLAALKRGEDGAALVFEGVVRNQTRGRQTLYLDYEAYEEMALQEMKSLAARSLKQFSVRDVAIVHRLGRLEVGETSVLIAVASAHRAAAFDACRWLIDTLKRTVPIWKKEYFVDGAVWADGEPFPGEIPRADS